MPSVRALIVWVRWLIKISNINMLNITSQRLRWDISGRCNSIIGAGLFYSLIWSLKIYHPTLRFIPWSLDLFIRVPFHLPGEHTVLQPFRRIELIVHIAISVLPSTHFHLIQVKRLRVKCLAQGQNILAMSQYWEGRNMIFLLKSRTKRESKPHGRQRHRQSSAL